MLIDEVGAVTPRNEAFKRELDAEEGRRGGEVLVVETGVELKGFTASLRDFEGVYMDCIRRSGGLAMLWHKSLKVSLLSLSSHHIDVDQLGTEGAWRFTGIYGWSETGQKLRTYRMIKDLATHSDLPWLMGVDINEIFYNFEKRGGVVRSQGVLDSFCEVFEECGLQENRTGHVRVVEERLDRFCVAVEWSRIFSEAKVLHLDGHYSDHLPILLKLSRRIASRWKEPKQFKFENMGVVQVAWEGIFIDDAWTSLDKKISACPKALLDWNENIFGDVRKQIQRLELRLEGEKDIVSRRGLFKELGEWRRKQERAKFNYLKYGDSNSGWFHARATMRRSTNSITKLEKADGIVTEAESEGSRWLVGNGESLVAGSDRWLPRPYLFKPICLRGNDQNVRVAKLINKELGC
ncbi:LOW QUALITY PROTEIN: hypothetical protein Cgig2_015843 [Carnegiea gigantea]|uniref:Reverse transcriptase n=1 Tax=Carnegiea gigantea TaxID=171969 RepID=A0A9Q1KHK1_9CARY|nr:LOW QUALITY PROTEIN: hypothetical protein Cgig2_015843 [Carnegiea gigantea]